MLYHQLKQSECITKSVFILANSVDPDEMPHFAASHLGLCCLYMFPF